MDGSAVEHSDSDSGDSWTLLDNNSNYADEAPDAPDHPVTSPTAEQHEKDDDTDGISIITDSEPDSSSPCQVNYEHYLTEENSTIEHPIPQFISVNSQLSDISQDSEKDDDDFLGDSNGKHKTYVHKRNKRLSTLLNIVMLGSVITAAGVAIGHMWGAKTDCSLHTSTNVNQILSNLYKLQEENAYLRGKLKELTAFNMQTNQKTSPKYNKCKKTFEEPLINDNGKINDKFTKCVDENKLLKSHMVAAATEKVEGSKTFNQDGKTWVLEQKDKFFKRVQQNQNNNDSNTKKDVEKKSLNDEYLNETKDLKYDRKSYADSLQYFEALNKIHSEPNYLKPDIIVHSNDQQYSHTKIKRDNTFNDKHNLRGETGTSNEFLHKNKYSEINSDKKKLDFGKYDFILNEKIANDKKRDNNRTLKVKNNNKENIEILKKEKGLKRHLKKLHKQLLKGARDKNGFDMGKILQEHYREGEELMYKTKEHKTRGDNQINTENIKEFMPENQNTDSNNNLKHDYEKNEDLKEKKNNGKRELDVEDLRKDNRYTGERKKQNRKNHDRKAPLKKLKRKNKYEQWEMKGGLLKDLYELSEVSSEEFENYFNEANVMENKNNIKNFADKIDKNFGTDDNQSDNNAGHFFNTQNTKGDTNIEEQDWFDKRALLRKEARKRQELFGKDASNAAGWYFRRMRKREQTRDKGDNSTTKKFLKRNMNK